MIKQTETAESSLASIVGAEHVRPATEADAVDGVRASWVVAPGAYDEVAAVLRLASAENLAVVPRGGGTKLGWGNPPRAADLVLSLHRLDAVLEHAAGDMTATVQAGCTVEQFGATLAEHGQRLALDALWPERATVGGLLAANDSGALRLRYGGPRDQALGVTLVLADGTVSRSGGKVVKNVAGYDLPKLLAGSLGTLGIILDATFRLYPLPRYSTTLSVPVPSEQAANELILATLDSTMAPTGLQLRAASDESPLVDVRFEGIEAGVAAQGEQFRAVVAGLGTAIGASEASTPVWQARQNLWQGQSPALVLKTSLPQAELGAFAEAMRTLTVPLRARWRWVAQAFGVGVLRIEGANEQVLLTALTLLRAEAVRRRGAMVVLEAPPEVKARADVWGYSGDALPLMRRVRERFDPAAILNPQRFVT